MPDSPARLPKPRQQVAALPFRRAKDGRLEILLITSRETRRWVIPKGWPIRGLKPYAAAAREALEEAGLVGQVAKRPLGSYLYEKRLEGGAVVTCAVDVFPFKARGQRKRWAEKGQREARWFPAGEAAQAVAEPDLSALIERLAADRLKADAPGTSGAPEGSEPEGPPPTHPSVGPDRKGMGATRLARAWGFVLPVR